MMRLRTLARRGLALVALLACAGAAPAQPSKKTLRGPTTLCGEAFALSLVAGETATVNDPGMDFIVYQVSARDGQFTLYEGNAPQPHDDELQTGLSWPSVIAIHDNRGSAAKSQSRIKTRLLTGQRRAAVCK